MFRVFERDFAGESPLYQRLSGLLAERTDLATPLLSAPHGQRRALLLFAAIQQILRVREPGHRLAEWYPSLGGTRSPRDPALLPAFADLVHRHQAEITEWCRSRTTQTNEVRRAALLRPALGFAADLVPGPLALIELGCSAGLLLVPDRYAFRYYNADRSETYGAGYPGGLRGPRACLAGHGRAADRGGIAGRHRPGADAADGHRRGELVALMHLARACGPGCPTGRGNRGGGRGSTADDRRQLRRRAGAGARRGAAGPGAVRVHLARAGLPAQRRARRTAAAVGHGRPYAGFDRDRE